MLSRVQKTKPPVQKGEQTLDRLIVELRQLQELKLLDIGENKSIIQLPVTESAELSMTKPTLDSLQTLMVYFTQNIE